MVDGGISMVWLLPVESLAVSWVEDQVDMALANLGGSTETFSGETSGAYAGGPVLGLRVAVAAGGVGGDYDQEGGYMRVGAGGNGGVGVQSDINGTSVYFGGGGGGIKYCVKGVYDREASGGQVEVGWRFKNHTWICRSCASDGAFNTQVEAAGAEVDLLSIR